jgi:tetratricopeptide (TPR) repeat protein
VLQSQADQALVTAGRALTLARQAHDSLAEARIRLTLGYHLADVLGRSREGLAELLAACQLAEQAGDQRVLYQALCHLAFVQRAEGQCAAARVSAGRALALTLYRPDEPPHPAAADALRELGEANAYLGRWQLAREQLRPLLTLYQTLNDPWAYGAVLYNYGLYSSNMGQHEDAIAALRRLVALSESVGLPANSDYGIWHRAGLARVLLAAGDVAAAGDFLHSLDTRALAPGRPFLAWSKAAAEHQLIDGKPAAALETLRPAVAWWRQNTSLHDADILLLLAQATPDADEALTALAQATRLLAPTDMYRYHPRLYYTLFQVTGCDEALAAAHAALAAQVAYFTDPGLRSAFLQQVVLHRAIMAG